MSDNVSEGYLTYQLEWEEIIVTIRYHPSWCQVIGHVEIRAEEPLPVSQTGYRSLWVTQKEVKEGGGVVSLIRDLLTQASNSPQWRNHHQQRKQLSLF